MVFPWEMGFLSCQTVEAILGWPGIVYGLGEGVAFGTREYRRPEMWFPFTLFNPFIQGTHHHSQQGTATWSLVAMLNPFFIHFLSFLSYSVHPCVRLHRGTSDNSAGCITGNQLLPS